MPRVVRTGGDVYSSRHADLPDLPPPRARRGPSRPRGPVTRRLVTTLLGVVAVILVVGSAVWMATAGRRAPRSDRVWAVDHSRPVRADIGDAEVVLHDVRDFEWTSPTEFEERFRTERVALDDVRAVWFVLAPFAERWRGLAHSFVSFELTGDRFLAVSVEARREEAEAYSLARGLWRGFETTYVVGTEHDLVGLRALRGDTLFVYPSRATPEQARSMFVDMMGRAESLRSSPEFYHTILNNCNTNLRTHVNRVASEPLPWGWGILLPGYSDALALDHGLLDTDLDLEAARARFRVDDRAREALGSGDAFGRAIRQGMPGR